MRQFFDPPLVFLFFIIPPYFYRTEAFIYNLFSDELKQFINQRL